jgi:hypothetical protein
MAGDIWITKHARWPVNYSLYNWVLEFLIDRIKDPETLADLELIRDNNLGTVNADRYPPAGRAAIVAALRDELVPDVEKRLPGDDWAEYRDALRELAEMAAADTPSGT